MDAKPSIEEFLNYINAQVPNMGSGWRKMKCPFHGDSHASAAVNFDKNIFKCHGCDVKGDTYTLIQYEKGCSFREAIDFAQTVLTTGNTAVYNKDSIGRRVLSPTESIGRRSQHLSLGGGRRTTARS